MILRSFAKSYIICGGDKNSVRHLLKYRFRVMHDEFDIIYDEPNTKGSRVRDQYLRALYKARERVILFSPYYFPDLGFLKALWQAKKRGVRVDLLIPFRSDLRIATAAAFTWFGIMRRAGGRIHFLNKEENLLTSDTKFVKKIKEIVLEWIDDAKILEDKQWVARGRWRKFKEWMALKVYQAFFGVK